MADPRAFTKEEFQCIQAEEINGFGFQPLNEECPGGLVFAKIGTTGSIDSPEYQSFSEADTMSLVTTATGSNTFRIINFLGRDFMSVHFSEWNLIPKIVKALLIGGQYWIAIHNNMKVSFNAKDLPPDPNDFEFTWQLMERKFISDFKKYANDFYRNPEDSRDSWVILLDSHIYPDHVLTKPWNYCTPEGKQFCAELRERLGKPATSKKYGTKQIRFLWRDQICDKVYKKLGVYFRGSDWCAYEPSWMDINDFVYKKTPECSRNKSPPHKRQKVADHEEESTCVVCMDSKPSTLVEPCGHMIVCESCSKNLETTADKTTCVKCRQSIIDVVYLPKEAIE
jgi:hypothetical protein